jgi:asparagine synthase (glutamine-hydrolysing)
MILEVCVCGIAGYFDVAGSLGNTRQILLDMTNAIAHRGPDGCDVWQDEFAGLGHRRLAIIDLVTGHQPMWDATGKTIIVFNGEIYNYPELREELENRGHVFKTSSDTEVIPAAIREWGIEQGLLRLRGMFSFALYDTVKRSLILARDRVGIKPMFWTKKNGIVYYASEAKSLLLPGLAERALDPVSLHDYLSIGYAVTPRTAWRDIHFLPPGSWMEISLDGERIGRYWQWTPKPDLSTTEPEWLDKFESIFSDTLRCHLLSDVPLGAFLSGGIDSSLIVALLARKYVERLHTFNVSFDEAAFDEAPYARMVAQQYDTQHEEILVASQNATIDTLKNVMEQFDEPFADPASLPNYLLSEATAKRVKVVLSGDGGDELLGGYPVYRRHTEAERMSRLQWAGAVINPVLAGFKKMGFPLSDRVYRYWEHGKGPVAQRLERLFSLYSESERTEKYTNDFLVTILGAGPTFSRLENLIPSDIADPFDRLFAFEFRMRLQGGYLRKVDITSSAFGLEIRVPFLDNEMLALSETLPIHMKIHGSQLKYLGYKLAGKYLPQAVVNRRKHGFNFPFDNWSRSTAVKKFLKDLLFDPRAKWRHILKSEFLETAWNGFAGNGNSLSRGRSYASIYSLSALELWLQKWNPVW